MTLNSHPRLNNALAAFANEYVPNRFKYLYEVDVQVLLSKILEAHFNETHIIIKEHNKRESLNETNKFDIGKVHREYPAEILFDNVILGEPKQLIDKSKTSSEASYHQPVKYAVELKFIPLYQRGVANTDNSINDYKRMVSKIKKLKFHQELKYAIQLTIFQSIEEQSEFLNNNNNLEKRQKWEEGLNILKSLIKENTNTGYYYIDLDTSGLLEVIK